MEEGSKESILAFIESKDWIEGRDGLSYEQGVGASVFNSNIHGFYSMKYENSCSEASNNMCMCGGGFCYMDFRNPEDNEKIADRWIKSGF